MTQKPTNCQIYFIGAWLLYNILLVEFFSLDLILAIKIGRNNLYV